MSALRSRLAKLETRTGGKGRFFTVRSSAPFTKEEVHAFLMGQGLNPTPADRICYFRTTIEGDDEFIPGDGPNPWVISGMQLVNVRAVNAPGGLVE